MLVCTSLWLRYNQLFLRVLLHSLMYNPCVRGCEVGVWPTFEHLPIESRSLRPLRELEWWGCQRAHCTHPLRCPYQSTEHQRLTVWSHGVSHLVPAACNYVWLSGGGGAMCACVMGGMCSVITVPEVHVVQLQQSSRFPPSFLSGKGPANACYAQILPCSKNIVAQNGTH